MDNKDLKVAIVHDVFDSFGGAEKVVQAFVQIWPQADIYVSRVGPNFQWKKFHDQKIFATFMNKLPFFKSLAKFYTPLYPLAFESLDLRKYDLVISSTAHFAKGVLTTPEQVHISYCHTPPRFLYHYPSESQTRNHFLFKPFVNILDHFLRLYDYSIAQRPDCIVTNSENTATRIRKFYRREPKVIYPPIEIPRHVQNDRQDYFLIVSRLVAYKNIDTVIQAFKKIPDKLIIIGSGPEENKLKALANGHTNIEFKGFIEEQLLSKYYREARALIFSSSDEDFGLVPAESIAHNTPVIAYKSGGVQEIVLDGQNGIFYDNNQSDSLLEALKHFKSVEQALHTQNLVPSVEKFSQDSFSNQLITLVNELQKNK